MQGIMDRSSSGPGVSGWSTVEKKASDTLKSRSASPGVSGWNTVEKKASDTSLAKSSLKRGDDADEPCQLNDRGTVICNLTVYQGTCGHLYTAAQEKWCSHPTEDVELCCAA